jgi:hypothetical protein
MAKQGKALDEMIRLAFDSGRELRIFVDDGDLSDEMLLACFVPDYWEVAAEEGLDIDRSVFESAFLHGFHGAPAPIP